MFLFWLWVLNSRILILSLFWSFSCLTMIRLLTAAPYNTNLYVLWCSIRVHVQLINVWCQGKLYAMHIRQPVINLANLKYCSRLSVNSWSKEDWFSYETKVAYQPINTLRRNITGINAYTALHMLHINIYMQHMIF